ncbi:MAG: NAD(P)H-hydrate dehydratase [Prevotellaceae bacterium]|jgi:NAD(P)H-hydrate epimerase|nr:NAD(P)H-hydrate dehydratase [Prevotellaceae bacterium]
MKILTQAQIKAADQYTIEHEPIASIDLMERASTAIALCISKNIDKRLPLLFLVGKGNNGGDGLAVARILHVKGYRCSVYPAFGKQPLSPDCELNLNRLPDGVQMLDSIDNISTETIIVDALLGTGVSGELKEPARSLIVKINKLGNTKISIDLPSGMKTEFGNAEQTILKADITLTLEFPKLAMLLPESGEMAGTIAVVPIGLNKKYMEQADTKYHYIDPDLITNILKQRRKFAHKNVYGHALLIAGSRGMTGAAILAAGACLRSGCGLLTVHVPDCERLALHVSCPSAILSLDEAETFSAPPQNLDKYSATGLGCGIGTGSKTVTAVAKLLKSTKIPMVIDADALNIIAENKELQTLVPPNSILTPHLGELKRLIGQWKSEEDKEMKVAKLSAKLKSTIVVKGAHTAIYMPDGNIYFNSTGNAGMAKAGSGDVLTGLITGLLARGYSPAEAAISGVYFHGLAGDRAKTKHGEESMNSLDIVNQLAIS